MNLSNFNIKFKLKNKCAKYLIPVESECLTQTVWKIDSLQLIKSELNECKSLLNDINLKLWSIHTKFTDNSSLISNTIKKQLKIKPHLLTRAWIKYYEILSNYELIENNDQLIRVLFLCEAPGSFITAFNHFIKSNFNELRFEWLANSLNPYYEDIDINGSAIIDDRFIRDINCYNNWLFGSTNTGNIMDSNFLRDLQKRVDDQTKFHLITCDGSINCVEFPESQELVVFPLIFREILISLSVLKQNGNLIVKCFTVFECQTICALYLLCCVFDEIDLFKPIASKSGNSEIYVICKGFNFSKDFRSLLTILMNINITETNNALFSLKSLPVPYLTELEKCVRMFADRQQITIQNNLSLFKNMNEKEKSRILNTKKFIARRFIKQYKIFSIPIEFQLTSFDLSVSANCLQFEHLYKFISNAESYNNRKQMQVNFVFNDWFQKLIQVLRQTNSKINCDMFLSWKKQLINSYRINFVYGIRFENIRCSKFCDLSLLSVYNRCAKYLIERDFQLNLNFISFSCETEFFLKKLLSQTEETQIFSYVFCNERNNFTDVFCRLFDKNCPEIITNYRTHELQMSYRKLLIIDTYQDFYDLNLTNEHKETEKLLSLLCEHINNISNNDLLILHINLSLTRLKSAILYMIAKLFRFYGFIPCINSQLANRHGLMCIFNNITTDTNVLEITGCLSQVLVELNSKANDFHSSLLEVIPIPVLISDTDFYECLFNANSIQMFEILKSLTHLKELSDHSNNTT